MGMSASQARLIELTARMNDTEYEGQQINQQRLVLSNKMNEVQELAMRMEVPTPPSKQDYLYDVYTGKDRAGKNVTVVPNADGSFDVIQQMHGSIIAKGDKLDVTEGSTSSSGSSSSSSTQKSRTLGEVGWDPGDLGRDITVYVPDLKKEQKECTDQSVLRALSSAPSNGASAGKWQLPSGVDITYDTKEGKDGEVEYSNFKASGYLFTGNMIPDDSDTIEVIVHPDGSLDPASYKDHGSVPSGYELDTAEITSQKCKTAGGKSFDTVASVKSVAANALADHGANGVIGYYLKDENGTKLTMDDLIIDRDTYQIKKDLVIWHPKAPAKTSSTDGQTVNGRRILTIEDACNEFGNDADSTWGNAKSALEHSYGTDYSDWRVIVDESGDKVKFSFCKAYDINQGKKVQVYNVGEGDFDGDAVKVSGDSIIFDETGHPEELILPDNTRVKLAYGQEVDEIAYDAAMNKYNIEKADYDREQNELNKKTSIYQRQDKQLELKLTRLDSERNALNTELEAVKKVIQDAIDKGFKTFSG